MRDSKILRRLPFPPGVRAAVLRAAEGHKLSPGELSQLNFRLGQVFAEALLAACRKFRVSPRRIALIGSHGQTIYHQGAPSRLLGSRVASTLQIGEPAVIAARNRHHHRGRFSPGRHRRRRPRRAAGSLGGLSALSRSAIGPRRAQYRRHCQSSP